MHWFALSAALSAVTLQATAAEPSTPAGRLRLQCEGTVYVPSPDLASTVRAVQGDVQVIVDRDRGLVAFPLGGPDNILVGELNATTDHYSATAAVSVGYASFVLNRMTGRLSIGMQAEGRTNPIITFGGTCEPAAQRF